AVRSSRWGPGGGEGGPALRAAPIVALGRRPTGRNLARPAAVSKVLRPWDQALIRQPPTIAASVLPAATLRDNKIESATRASAISVGMPTANAAAKIAGQMRRPRKRTAAKARPAGGQMGTALE